MILRTSKCNKQTSVSENDCPKTCRDTSFANEIKYAYRYTAENETRLKFIQQFVNLEV